MFNALQKLYWQKLTERKYACNKLFSILVRGP
ncbi:hypothetical protein IS160_2575, partial [Staphylococcus aureus subsp. aureus IS-160]